MPRPLRIEIADGIYHVTNRGLERRQIVRAGQNRCVARRIRRIQEQVWETGVMKMRNLRPDPICLLVLAIVLVLEHSVTRNGRGRRRGR